MKQHLSSALVLTIAVLMPSLASEPLEINLNTGTCRLTERGLGVKRDGIDVKGIRDGEECHAFISDEIIKTRSICVLSGLYVSSAPSASYYGCRVSRELKGYLFRAQLEPKDIGASSINCDFMCY
jgi:hypothetical protein